MALARCSHSLGGPAALALLVVVPLACSSSDSSPTTSAGIGSGVITTPKGAGYNFGLGALEPSAAAKGAVLLGSCYPDDGVNQYLERLYSYRSESQALLLGTLSCLVSKANGCQALEDCLGAAVDLKGPCEPHCEGNVIVGCDDQLRFRQDCARLGLVCVAGGGDCQATSLGASCDSSYPGECKEGRPMNCSGSEGHVTAGLLCSDFGLECGPSSLSGGKPVCRGKEGDCTATTGNYLGFKVAGLGCSGSSLRTCLNGGAHTLDCGEVASGFTCQEVEGSFFCGQGTECDAGDSGTSTPRSTCEGDQVVFCNAGLITKIDCKQLGFTGCNANYGVCVPGPYTGL